LRAGEKKTVALTLKGEQLAYWNSAQHRFVVEDDRVQLMVGSSSADIKLNKTVRVVR
jgi:beta-glucosidase